MHATYDIVTQEAFTVASEKSARGATLASWQQSHGSGGIVIMSWVHQCMSATEGTICTSVIGGAGGPIYQAA